MGNVIDPAIVRYCLTDRSECWREAQNNKIEATLQNIF